MFKSIKCKMSCKSKTLKASKLHWENAYLVRLQNIKATMILSHWAMLIMLLVDLKLGTNLIVTNWCFCDSFRQAKCC